MRNQSVVVDNMQGQVKSTLDCPRCARTSITFDPFMFLSVPLPTEKNKVCLYTFVSSDPTIPPTICNVKCIKDGCIQDFRQAVANQHGNQVGNPSIDQQHLIVCDIWKSKTHKIFKSSDSVSTMRPPQDDIYVYHTPPLGKRAADEPTAAEAAIADHGMDTGPPRQNKPFEIQMTIRKQSSYSTSYDIDPVGIPLYIRLDESITNHDLLERLHAMLRPYLKTPDDPESYIIQQNKKTYGGYGSSGSGEEIPDTDDRIGETYGGIENLSLRVEWKSKAHYLAERGLEPQPHPTAPQGKDGAKRYGASSRNATVNLSACLDAYTEAEELTLDNVWYCSNCKDFVQATKKMDIYKTPNTLIIHLKRFNYTKRYTYTMRDKINTLVDFPLEGLDIAKWVTDFELRSQLPKDTYSHITKEMCIYDCFGVSNHMGGMGGGHYTAYARALTNGDWYSLNDSTTHKVSNPSTAGICSSSAYVLYYQRRGTHKGISASNPSPSKSKPKVL